MKYVFRLRNNQQQILAKVLYFYEEELDRNIGIIITTDLTRHTSWIYQMESMHEVIADLASRLGLIYDHYIENKVN